MTKYNVFVNRTIGEMHKITIEASSLEGPEIIAGSISEQGDFHFDRSTLVFEHVDNEFIEKIEEVK